MTPAMHSVAQERLAETFERLIQIHCVDWKPRLQALVREAEMLPMLRHLGEAHPRPVRMCSLITEGAPGVGRVDMATLALHSLRLVRVRHRGWLALTRHGEALLPDVFAHFYTAQ